jgi:hypothetical protein
MVKDVELIVYIQAFLNIKGSCLKQRRKAEYESDGMSCVDYVTFSFLVFNFNGATHFMMKHV